MTDISIGARKILNVLAGIAGQFNSTSLVSIDSATEITQGIVGNMPAFSYFYQKMVSMIKLVRKKFNKELFAFIEVLFFILYVAFQ